MKKFFSGLLVTILVIVIVGGLGYIGYSFLFMGGHGGMNMANNTTQNNTTQNQTSTQGSNSSNSSMNMQGGSMNMQNGSMNNQAQPSGSQSTLQQVNYALQNKESIDKAINLLNDTMKSVTMEPYSSNNAQNNANTQQQKDNVQPNNTTGTAANTQGNTTINIYPSNVQPGNSMTNNNVTSMSTSYDPVKMEKFHNGLYKVSTGIELLKQVEDDLINQAEQAGTNVNDQVAYYTNQYNMTLQNMSKLNQALYDINEASDLLNINPYVSVNGLVYDKDRMQQVHGSIFKLAQSVVTLNKLSSDMTKQAITLINTAQTYANASQMDMSSMNMPGLFSNINISSIINIILIVFGGAFIIGLLGFVSSLFKPSTPQVNKN